MFSNLMDFGYERTGKQAVGFYLAYFFLFLAIVFSISMLLVLITGSTDKQLAFRLGNVFGIIVCLTLSILIAQKKKLFSSFKALLIIALTGVLSALLGCIGGLIPVAYLSTVKSNT